MKKQHLILLFTILIVVLVFLDQWLKIWVKTNLCIYENLSLIGNWFSLHFVENEGMAFGLSWGANAGKLALTLLRIVLSGALIFYVVKKIRENKSSFLIVTIFALVIAGAIGNVIDCIFYGVIFNVSTPDTLAVAFSPEGGYSGYFYGSVVDMFAVRLFPIPEWVPGFGGSWFFPAIFNIADSCVTVGIILMLIFNKKIFPAENKQETEIPPCDRNDNQQL